MKKKLVKRPLLAYASGKKGDVYGYDWGSVACITSLIGFGFSVPSIATGLFGAMAVSFSAHMVAYNCLPY